MSSRTVILPRFLLEDALSLLRSLVMLAWLGVFAAVATEWAIRHSGVYEWPTLGGFSGVYHAIVAEFLASTLVLTILLVRRDWFERIPRESVHRLRWLLTAVVIWLGLHLFCAFHVSGSARGPLMLLLPVLMMAALAALPGRAGWLATAYLVAGYALVLVLEQHAIISPRGLLTEPFAYGSHASGFGWSAVAMVLLLAVWAAWALRGWMYPDGPSLNPAQRIDAESGLFRRTFLMQRLQSELGRIRRQGGCAALLLIAVDEQPGRESTENLRIAASTLLQQVRIESDTPALYDPGVLAVLLPAAGTDGAISAARRMVSHLSAAGLPARFRAAAIATCNGEAQIAPMLAGVESALRRAEAGGDVVVLTAG
jgi:hypothetical protein